MPVFMDINTTAELQSKLDIISRHEIVEIWRSIHKRYPPKHLNTSLIKRSIIYEWQCAKYGGVKRQILSDIRHTITTQGASVQKITIGTQLMREWRDKTYKVHVTEDGYIHNDTTYKSLSAIAKHITGMEYSGYRFFGLKKVNLKRLSHNNQKVAS